MKTILPFDDESLINVPALPGVYKVHSKSEFPRLQGSTNIIYIGKANNLKRRIRSLWYGNSRTARVRFERLRKHGIDLFFSFETYEEPKLAERMQVEMFEKKHLELPPLNHSN